LEAWEVPDLLAENQIGVGIFADHWGYKKEAYDTSVRAPAILSNHGVSVAFKSDHPVLNSQNLIFEAAKAHSYGFDAALAIQAVTSVPAKLMGQDWRIGMIQPGYDADVVIWDRYPLDIGAKPVSVYIDGYETFNAGVWPPVTPKVEPATNESIQECPRSQSYKIMNISKIYADKDLIFENAEIVVEEGIIVCVGGHKACQQTGLDVIDGLGGSMIPGIVSGSSRYFYFHFNEKKIGS
jgi:imidazolonepropionase-like amidohydrolase